MPDNRWVEGMALVTNTEPGDRESVDYIIKTLLHCLANDFLPGDAAAPSLDRLPAGSFEPCNVRRHPSENHLISMFPNFPAEEEEQGVQHFFGDPWRLLSVPEL